MNKHEWRSLWRMKRWRKSHVLMEICLMSLRINIKLVHIFHLLASLFGLILMTLSCNFYFWTLCLTISCHISFKWLPQSQINTHLNIHFSRACHQYHLQLFHYPLNLIKFFFFAFFVCQHFEGNFALKFI